MTYKFVDKKDLAIVHGHLTDGNGNLVRLANAGDVALDLNHLEFAYQKAMYIRNLDNQEPPEPFKRSSIKFDVKDYLVEEPETPLADKREEEAMALMAEADEVCKVSHINEYLEHHSNLVEFVTSEKLIVDDEGCNLVFDTPEIGDPLELSLERLIEILKFIGDTDMTEPAVTFSCDRDGDSLVKHHKNFTLFSVPVATTKLCY